MESIKDIKIEDLNISTKTKDRIRDCDLTVIDMVQMPISDLIDRLKIKNVYNKELLSSLSDTIYKFNYHSNTSKEEESNTLKILSLEKELIDSGLTSSACLKCTKPLVEAGILSCSQLKEVKASDLMKINGIGNNIISTMARLGLLKVPSNINNHFDFEELLEPYSISRRVADVLYTLRGIRSIEDITIATDDIIIGNDGMISESDLRSIRHSFPKLERKKDILVHSKDIDTNIKSSKIAIDEMLKDLNINSRTVEILKSNGITTNFDLRTKPLYIFQYRYPGIVSDLIKIRSVIKYEGNRAEVYGEQDFINLLEIDYGISRNVGACLARANFDNVKQIETTTDEVFINDIRGIGGVYLSEIRKAFPYSEDDSHVEFKQEELRFDKCYTPRTPIERLLLPKRLEHKLQCNYKYAELLLECDLIEVSDKLNLSENQRKQLIDTVKDFKDNIALGFAYSNALLRTYSAKINDWVNYLKAKGCDKETYIKLNHYMCSYMQSVTRVSSTLGDNFINGLSNELRELLYTYNSDLENIRLCNSTNKVIVDMTKWSIYCIMFCEAVDKFCQDNFYIKVIL